VHPLRAESFIEEEKSKIKEKVEDIKRTFRPEK